MAEGPRPLEGVVMDRAFWNGKKVLITGYTGFKGSWLSLWLQSLGAEVVGYALRPPTDPNLFEFAKVADGMTCVEGDIRNLKNLHALCARYRPEVVFHLAAQPIVHLSYKNPVETYSVNVMGTVNLLEAVRQASSIRAVVAVTSDKCYENSGSQWGYRENDLLGGHDPYSASKACAELAIASFRSSFFPSEEYDQHGVAVASVRAGNVIGGGDWTANRLIPDIVRAVSDDQPVSIRNPATIRPWQFVLEPLNGYISLAERLWIDGPKFAQEWNFGPNEDEIKPVSWIVDRFTSLWGNGARWELDPSWQPHEDAWLMLYSTKAKRLLKWAPRLTLPDTLEWTVEWYSAWMQGKNMRSVTESQILRFQSLMDTREQ